MKNIKNCLLLFGLATATFACSQKTRDLSIQKGTLIPPFENLSKDNKEKPQCPDINSPDYGTVRADPSCPGHDAHPQSTP